MIHSKDGAKDNELFGFSVSFDKFLAIEDAKKDAARARCARKGRSGEQSCGRQGRERQDGRQSHGQDVR